MAKRLPEKIIEMVEALRDKKGIDVQVLDLRHLKNALCDFFIVCTGNNDRQTLALADSVYDRMRNDFRERPLHQEGRARGEWILQDYGDVVVHIMLPSARDFYRIEDLWADAEVTEFANVA
jgi:ribosome-associated protein